MTSNPKWVAGFDRQADVIVREASEVYSSRFEELLGEARDFLVELAPDDLIPPSITIGYTVQDSMEDMSVDIDLHWHNDEAHIELTFSEYVPLHQQVRESVLVVYVTMKGWKESYCDDGCGFLTTWAPALPEDTRSYLEDAFRATIKAAEERERSSFQKTEQEKK